MTDTRIVRRVLRGVAVVVAIAAIIDPALTSARYGTLVVSVVASDTRDPDVAALAVRVGKSLGASATVIAAPFAGADATVIVGDRLPDATVESAAPVFAVAQGADEPRIAIESMDMPRNATLDAAVPVSVGARVIGAAGRTVETTLSTGGVTVDRVTRQVRSADERLDVVLNAVAGDTGTLALRVEARVAGGAAVDAAAGATADGAVDVREHRSAVLFFDTRPSFASTFVRRAVERDARFAVTARSMTSRAISIDAGAPPARLDDAAPLSQYDVIVVGAPGGLSEAAVGGLDSYLRTRGGSVVFLLDDRQAAPFERLTGARDWRTVSGQVIAVKNVAGAPSLRATSFAWPAVLPVGASAIAMGDSARPAVWKSPVGAGQVVVSGALDAWRFRDAGSSAFERFWRDQIADAAAHALPAIAVAAPSAAAPNDRVSLAIDLRDAALRLRAGAGAQSLRASVGAKITRVDGQGSGAGAPADLRVWPSGSVGHFESSIRAPSAPGVYRIDVESGADRVSVPLVVREDAGSAAPAAPAAPAARATVDAWVAGHGGAVIGAHDLGALPAAIRAATSATPRAEPWHPMRSAWWLALFALALSAEWWLRRRRGLA